MSVLIAVVLGLSLVRVVVAQDARPTQAGTRAATTRVAVRNPSQLRAAELLGRAGEESTPRVRFEWDQVPGATAYLLRGQWMTTRSWATQSRELRVIPASATSWTAQQVSVELTLPEGSHSWKLVAVFGPDDLGDFEHPTRLSFEVR